VVDGSGAGGVAAGSVAAGSVVAVAGGVDASSANADAGIPMISAATTALAAASPARCPRLRMVSPVPRTRTDTVRTRIALRNVRRS
jgi:hypothetical protein